LHDDWLTFLALGLVGVSLFYTLQNVALTLTTSVDVGLIMNDIPILTTLLGIWLLKERFAWRSVWGMALATFGVALISLNGFLGSGTGGSARLLGDVLAFVATLFGALSVVGGKWALATYDAITVTTQSSLLGVLMLMPILAWEGITLRLSPAVWACVLGLALGSGAIANWLWWYAVRHLPVSQVGIFLYITPFVSTFLGVIVLREPATLLSTIAGATLVIGGVVLVQARNRQVEDYGFGGA
jgi:drug/metabolite transporter (DMT)-like permease